MKCRGQGPSGIHRLSGPVFPVCALLAGLVLSSPVLAETLADRIALAAGSGGVTLPAGTTSGRADISGRLTLTGEDGATLTAPADDAILVALPGAEVRLSGVDLLQEGQTKFAVYVDGGSVWLTDCAISGAFEVAIYVASGNLTVQDCAIDGGLYGIQAAPGSTVTLDGLQMTGQGDTGVRADGASLAIHDLTLADGGENGLIVIDSPDLRIDGLTLSGILSTGIWLQNPARADLSRLSVEVSGLALTLSGGGTLDLDGFVLNGTQGALVAEGITESLSLMRGRLQSGEGATTAYLHDIRGLRLDDVQIVGGETGLYLTGALPLAQLSHLFLHSQGMTGLFVDTLAEGSGLVLTDLHAVASGAALAAYFRDSGPVICNHCGLIAAGPLPFASEGASAPVFDASAIFSAPDPVDAHLPIFATPDLPPRFLPTGALWWDTDTALGSGTIIGSLASLTELLPAGSGLTEPLVDFATTGPFDPGALSLAIAYALPIASDAGDQADLITLSLAPPEEGWLWDATATIITLTDASGETVTATPGDFPLHLAAGTYALALDGQPIGNIRAEPGAVLILPLPDAPFYAWRDGDGTLRRGPALYLRPKADLAALMAGFRPLRPGEYWGYAQSFAPRRGADRALAARIIAAARTDIPALLTELADLRATEAWPDFNLRWQRIRMLLDILSQFGNRDDAAWLLSLTIPPDIQIDQIETAVLIETRLEALTDGAALPTAIDRLASFDSATPADRLTTQRLVKALARSGLPAAQPLLADLARRLQPKALTDRPDPFGIIELSRLDPEIAGDLPSAYLDQLSRHTLAHLSGDRPPDELAPNGLDLWNAAVAALAYEAIHAAPGTAPRRLPIPVAAGIGTSAWAFADPETLMSGPLALTGPADPGRISGWTYRFPEYLCAALAYRTPADRALLLDRLRLEVIDAVTPAVTPDEDESDFALMADQAAMVGFALDLTLGECVLSDAILNSFGRDNDEEEKATFDQLDYEPLWWLRRPRSHKAISDFAAGVDYPTLGDHSALTMEEVQTALATGALADPALQDLFLARHALMSDAFQSSFDTLTFAAERRQFRLRSDGGTGSITIAGYLDIRPLLSDGKLIVAIRHRIESPDYGGLAAMITEPDRAPYEADNRRLMFDQLVLDRAGRETVMDYQGSSASGIHYFTAPLETGLADTALHLSMRFVETRWEIDLPLWASTTAHDLRAGAATKGGQD